MTDTLNCVCCRAVLDGVSAEDLCNDCHAAFHAIRDTLAPSYKLHVLAAVLTHSRREIARRLECTATCHASAIGNATRASGIPRERLFKAAAWGLNTGQFEKPAGFEDCTTNGEVQARTVRPPMPIYAAMTAADLAELAEKPLGTIVKSLSVHALGKHAGIGKSTAALVKTGEWLVTPEEMERLRASLRGAKKPGRGASPPQPRVKDDKPAEVTPASEPEPEFVGCDTCRHFVLPAGSCWDTLGCKDHDKWDPPVPEPTLIVERDESAEEHAAFQEAMKAGRVAAGFDRAAGPDHAVEILIVSIQRIASRRRLAAIEAEEAQRAYRSASVRLSELMLGNEALDDAPALMRAAYKYGRARGYHEALESLEEAS